VNPANDEQSIVPEHSVSDADRVDFDAAKAAKDEPMTDPFDPRCARASDIPITRASSGPLFPGHPADEVDVMTAAGAEVTYPNLQGNCSAGDATTVSEQG
jgi:hypothetical protein